MKFLSYGDRGAERGAILTPDGYCDLEAVMRNAGLDTPTAHLRTFLSQPDWPALLPRLAAATGSCKAIAPSTVRLGAPVPDPGQIVLAGVNFRSHKKEVLDDTTPKRPVVLGKMATSVVGPHDDIIRPPEIAKLDYEGEVAVVIGRTARRVSASQARDCIAGYTIINDVSGRDLQLAEHESNPFFRMHFLGKSADTFAPMGPHLVTRDEFDPSEPFRIRTHVDGELRQDGDTSGLIFPMEEFISYVSTFATLRAGDVIATGTPGGVGHFMQPPCYLRDGNVVEIEVGGIGRIRNRVVDEVIAARSL